MWYVTIDHSRESGPEIHSFSDHQSAKVFFDRTIKTKAIQPLKPDFLECNSNRALVNGWDIRVNKYDDLTPFMKKCVDMNLVV